jgi:hypothetical protein
MSYFDDANQLVKFAKEHFTEIEETYNASLSQKEINPKLLIEIKNFMENIRSALDYAANGIYQKYGSSTDAKPKIYFPYASLNQSKEEFQKSRRIDTCIPGLTSSRADIVMKLMSYQHFESPKNKWLPIFMELNNENKHQQLTPQIRKEMKELRISSGGASISMTPGASITMTPGASIRIGNMLIQGDQNIDVNNPPKTTGPGRKEIITWVSFLFSSNSTPVIQLLKQSLEGTEEIVKELAAL